MTKKKIHFLVTDRNVFDMTKVILARMSEIKG